MVRPPPPLRTPVPDAERTRPQRFTIPPRTPYPQPTQRRPLRHSGPWPPARSPQASRGGSLRKAAPPAPVRLQLRPGPHVHPLRGRRKVGHAGAIAVGGAVSLGADDPVRSRPAGQRSAARPGPRLIPLAPSNAHLAHQVMQPGGPRAPRRTPRHRGLPASLACSRSGRWSGPTAPATPHRPAWGSAARGRWPWGRALRLRQPKARPVRRCGPTRPPRHLVMFVIC